ncbi:MAG: UDP-N-acetylmuramate dehydrogenase [Spirochaetales bacterium]|nr:UDP-N-acetylmuramate dehydrogenase [Spirochaetales bacterium]
MDKQWNYRYYSVVCTVRNIIERINIDEICHTDYVLAPHTSFGVGGPAQLCIRPRNKSELVHVIHILNDMNIHPIILGGGANVLIPDAGVRSTVLMTDLVSGIKSEKGSVTAFAGTLISDVSVFAAEQSLSGLEFIYKMPGTVGGAVWMNARCYGSSIADVLDWIEYCDEQGRTKRIAAGDAEFGYKDSIFQHRQWIITECGFVLKKGDPSAIRGVMEENAGDRNVKGHFSFPCAGSVFKNDRKFGKPSGAIIDECGLKGTRIGGAQVAPYHGNIIINTGTATAEDIYRLVVHVQEKVYERTGHVLDPEIILVKTEDAS